MKGAFLLTFDTAVLSKVRRAIAAAGGVQWEGCQVLYEAPDAVQLEQLGTDHLFSLDEYDERPDVAWAYRDGPHLPGPGVTLPNMSAIVAYGIDCRWEDLFARLVRAVTEISGQPAWVLDNDAVVWDARTVDPTKVRL